MTGLNEHLLNYIKHEVEIAIAKSTGSFLRIVFSFPPQRYLSSLYDHITESGSGLIVDNGAAREEVPTYLLDNSAIDPDRRQTIARCTPTYLTTIRNMDQPVWLVLQEVSAKTNRSLETTSVPIGIFKEIKSFKDWMSVPVVEYLVDEIFDKYQLDNSNEDHNELIRYVLERLWKVDENLKDKNSIWLWLERLFLPIPESHSPRDVFLARTGLPYCGEEFFGKKSHLTVLERLSDAFQAKGLRSEFDDLEKIAEPNKLPYVREMRRGVENKNIIEANDFVRNPLFAYAPKELDGLAIPNWWYQLDIDTWHKLLDSGNDEPVLEEDVLSVELPEQIASLPKGLVPVTLNDVRLRISCAAREGVLNFVIERSNGTAAFQEVFNSAVSSDAPVEFVDENVPVHERLIRYRVSGDGIKPVLVKVIVLNRYRPGVVASNQGALKASPFKMNTKASDEKSKRKVSRYESDIDLVGMGSHMLDLFVSSELELDEDICGYEVDAEQEGPVIRRLSKISENHYSCLIDTDEDCYYDFSARRDGSGEVLYRVYISASDVKQEGARSEFERLILMNRASAHGGHESPRVDPYPCRIMDLEMWAQDSDYSFRPLILGPDYEECWRRPSWATDDPMSMYGLPLDPRPKTGEMNPVANFIGARKRVISAIKASNDKAAQPAASMKLYELMRDEAFVSLISDLLDAYLAWLEADYDNAAWSDLVCLHSEQATSKALESTPYAVLMTPFHPLKLAWQCCAQNMLQDALDRHSRCPAASVVSPTNFPDCFVLPCRTATGSVIRKGFVSISSSSDYWSVLRSVDPGDYSKLDSRQGIFGESFGIQVEGLSSGFSAQQVVRSLDEVSRLLSAKTSLRVGISSETGGASSCNQGVYAWCLSNLGDDQDCWSVAGKKSLIVEDFRESALQPEQAELASLTARSNAAVSWFAREESAIRCKTDLSIIAHLSTMSRTFDKQGVRSAVDLSGLTRWRVRKQLPGQNAAFIAESRIGEVPNILDAGAVTSRLLKCVDEIERQCREMFDSYIFAPDLANLDSVARHSRYTALSSDDIDPACFFGSTSKAYLWDYELPSYSKRAGENTGYYLLANESPGMLSAVRSALGLIGESSIFSDDQISGLLEEISRRGMPTLKRLTSGGSMSLGELGMLVALRVLQTDFELGVSAQGLLPATNNNSINLVVPADPFQKHYDDLRSALKYTHAERPDLLVLSIEVIDGKPRRMKITPIEVKARADGLPQAKRKEAIGQAKYFAGLLEEIRSNSEIIPLWGLAWRNLLATMLDYGFRVYGQLDKFMNYSEWAYHHSAILSAISTNDMEIEIDKRGRLIIVESSNDKSVHDTDNDGFNETIVIQHHEALSILSRSSESIMERVRENLGSWDLDASRIREFPHSRDNHSNGCDPDGDSVDIDNNDSRNDDEHIYRAPLVDSEDNEYEYESQAAEGGEAGEVDYVCDGTGIKFKVGSTVKQFTEEELFFFPSNTALNQLNVGIVGDLGTGKTQLIQGLVYQLTKDASMNRGKAPNILIFDYKRDYSKKEFVEATGAKVVSPFNMPLNLFDTRDSSMGPRAWLERSKFFIDILSKIYSGIGAVQGQNIKEAVKAAYKRFEIGSGDFPTINDVFEEYQGLVKSPDTPYSIMSDLVDGEYFVPNSKDVVPFSEFLKGVVVVDLSQVGQDDKTKNMLVVIFLNLFYEHMLKIDKQPFLGESPKLRFVDTMLLVDEADNIMKYEFDVLKKILLQGREFGVGVLLASQYLSHFRTTHENYLEPLLTWFLHKVPNVNVKELEGIGLAKVNPDLVEQIKTLNCHECLYKTFDVGGKIIRGAPFFELVKGRE